MKKIAALVFAMLLIGVSRPALAERKNGNKELVGSWRLQNMTGFEGDQGVAAMQKMLDEGAVIVYTFEQRGSLFQYLYVNEILTKLEDYYYIDETGIFVRSMNDSVPFRIENDRLTLYREQGEVTFIRVEQEDLPFIMNADQNTLWGNWRLVSAYGEGADAIVESIMAGVRHAYYFQNGMLFHAITEAGEENIYFRGTYDVKENTILLNDAFFAYFSIQGSNLYLYNDETRMMFSKME